MLWMGCTEEPAQVAGGSGSDLPKPTARLVDTLMNPIPAKVWRLWKIVKDSAYPTTQIADSMGFQVPPSGKWIVEAWSDSVQSGLMQGLLTSKITLDLSVCPSNLTYLKGQDQSKVGVQSCLQLEGPSVASRPTHRPVGVGVFGSQDSIKQMIRIPGNRGLGSFRFAIWRVSDSIKLGQLSPPTSADSQLVWFQTVRYSPFRGTIDITLPKGRWLVEGWSTDTKNQTRLMWEAQLPRARWVGRSLLNKCFQDPNGACGNNQPGAQLSRQDASEVFFVLQTP